MTSGRLLAVLVMVLAVIAISLVLLASESALSLWDRLATVPGWVAMALAAVLLALGGATGWAVWRLLVPAQKAQRAKAPPPTEASLVERIEAAQSQGVDVTAAAAELAQWRTRRVGGQVYVAVFGDVSVGKSSLIAALVPDAEIRTHVLGGTTQCLTEYTWHSPGGDRLTLVDMPGTNQVGGQWDQTARQEAQRAHVVIYVCDGDLTRTQDAELAALSALQKPIILALTKTDRYSDEALALVKQRLAERVADRPGVEIVTVQGGGSEQVVRVHADGREEIVRRERPADVQALAEALQRRIDESAEAMGALRDSAVFLLVKQKLDEAELRQRNDAADRLVNEYTRKAIVGALAAITPGTDILIQGYFGANLVREMCRLYGVAPREVAVDEFLKLAQGELRTTATVMLAVIGNGLKAFPGLGTVAGGLMHAVAYGMTFDALGRTLKGVLITRGELRPYAAVNAFRETLHADLEHGAGRFIEMALRAKKRL